MAVAGVTQPAAGRLTQRVSTYLASAVDTPLDETTDHLTRLHLLDTLAAIVACRDLEAAVVGRRFATLRGSATPEAMSATILGTRARVHLVDAAFAGAMTAHAAEINDFMPSVFVQPGPAVVSTALAVGESNDATLTDIVRAVAAGYDLAYRVPLAVGSGNLRRTGIASHGVGACFGAAAAAAALLRLTATQTADVLSVIAQQASGSWQWLLDVDHVEKAFVFGGLGARNGLESVLLVANGYRGVPAVIDRPGTWYTSTAFARPDGDGDLEALAAVGDGAALVKAAFKRYPVGGPAQPAVEALLALQPTCPADEVAHITIEMPGRWEAFRDAQMPALNLPYLAAVILLDGRLDVVSAQSLDRMHHDPEVARLKGLVEVRPDPAQEAGSGEERTESARVTVNLRDGTTVERFVPHVLGFPSHPMAAADVERKAHELVAPVLGASRAQQLIEMCRAPAGHRASSVVDVIASDDR